MEGLQYNILSMSQICDRGNEVKLSNNCLVKNCITGKVVTSAKRIKNMYVADLESIKGDYLFCLRSQIEQSDIWHRRLSHISSTLLNKLVVWGPCPRTSQGEVYKQ